jgi:hypothetical protein
MTAVWMDGPLVYVKRTKTVHAVAYLGETAAPAVIGSCTARPSSCPAGGAVTARSAPDERADGADRARNALALADACWRRPTRPFLGGLLRRGDPGAPPPEAARPERRARIQTLRNAAPGISVRELAAATGAAVGTVHADDLAPRPGAESG